MFQNVIIYYSFVQTCILVTMFCFNSTNCMLKCFEMIRDEEDTKSVLNINNVFILSFIITSWIKGEN